MASMNQATAAALLNVTDRRLRQLENEADPPPRDPDGTYPAAQFVRWMQRRALRKQRGDAAVRYFDSGFEAGQGAQLWRTAHELRELLHDAVDARAVGGVSFGRRIEPARRAFLAELTARAGSATSAAELRAVVLQWVDWTVHSDDAGRLLEDLRDDDSEAVEC
jgi:hypothetical protein